MEMSRLSPILRARRRMTDTGGSVFENAPEHSWADSTEDLTDSVPRLKPRRLTHCAGDVLQDRTNTSNVGADSKPRRLTHGAGDVLQDRTNVGRACAESISKSSVSRCEIRPRSPGHQKAISQGLVSLQKQCHGLNCGEQRSRSLSMERKRGAFEQPLRSSIRGYELKDLDVAEGRWEGVWDKVRKKAGKATSAVSQVAGKATVAVSQASKAIGSEVSAIREDIGTLTKDLAEGLQKLNGTAQCFLARPEGHSTQWNRPDAVEWVCNLNRGEGPKLEKLGIELAWDDNGPLIVSKIEKGCAVDAWSSFEQPVEVKLLPSCTVSVVHHLRVCPNDEIIAIDGVPVTTEARDSLLKGLRHCQSLSFKRQIKDPRRQAQ